MSLLQLPPPLAPWAPWLDLLPLDSALGLGPLLRRLDGLIGPMRASPQSGSVEPDGFDGLSRRGLPERLLLSEWLLADEAPLEFLRRLSQNESAFLQLARRDPHAARSSLALFDVGPDVLGGPRLAGFAALLVLARRAQTANASFRWGAWQKPGEWQSEVNRESLEWWLRLRGEDEASTHHRAAWEEVWQSENADFSSDELWLVGSPALRVLAPERARVLELSDELDPLAPDRAVIAGIDERKLRLCLPEETLGVRLLRDPFAHVAPPASNEKNLFHIERPDSNFVWAASGFKGFLRTENGALLALSIPNSPGATVGAPKVLRASHHKIVAAGRVGRATVAASLVSGLDGTTGLSFEAWGRGSGEIAQKQFNFQYPLGETEQTTIERTGLGQVLGVGNGAALAVLLGNGHFGLASGSEQVLRDEHVHVFGAVSAYTTTSVLMDDDDPTPRFHTFSIVNSAISENVEKTPVPQHLFGCHTGWGGQMQTPLWALDTGSYHWHLRRGELELEVNAHKTEDGLGERRQVVGCIARDGDDIGLLLTADWREIWFRGRGDDALVCRFSTTFKQVAVCPFARFIAVKGDGELGIYSLLHAAWLLKLRWD